MKHEAQEANTPGDVAEGQRVGDVLALMLMLMPWTRRLLPKRTDRTHICKPHWNPFCSCCCNRVKMSRRAPTEAVVDTARNFYCNFYCNPPFRTEGQTLQKPPFCEGIDRSHCAPCLRTDDLMAFVGQWGFSHNSGVVFHNFLRLFMSSGLQARRMIVGDRGGCVLRSAPLSWAQAKPVVGRSPDGPQGWISTVVRPS